MPSYGWDYIYNSKKATKTYSNNISDYVKSKHTQAMATLYFSKLDVKKAEMLRELKTTYRNNYKLALETELAV